MCRYCDRQHSLNKIQDARKQMLDGVDIFDVIFTDSVIAVFCNYEEEHIFINYCPMCGEKLKEDLNVYK